jgi:hypothetical protein
MGMVEDVYVACKTSVNPNAETVIVNVAKVYPFSRCLKKFLRVDVDVLEGFEVSDELDRNYFNDLKKALLAVPVPEGLGYTVKDISIEEYPFPSVKKSLCDGLLGLLQLTGDLSEELADMRGEKTALDRFSRLMGETLDKFRDDCLEFFAETALYVQRTIMSDAGRLEHLETCNACKALFGAFIPMIEAGLLTVIPKQNRAEA